MIYGGCGKFLISVTSAYLIFSRAALAASRAGIASSNALEASASSFAISTDLTSKNSFFSVACYCLTAAISDFSVISAISSYTTLAFSSISSFLMANSFFKASVSC